MNNKRNVPLGYTNVTQNYTVQMLDYIRVKQKGLIILIAVKVIINKSYLHATSSVLSFWHENSKFENFLVTFIS